MEQYVLIILLLIALNIMQSYFHAFIKLPPNNGQQNKTNHVLWLDGTKSICNYNLLIFIKKQVIIKEAKFNLNMNKPLLEYELKLIKI